MVTRASIACCQRKSTGGSNPSNLLNGVWKTVPKVFSILKHTRFSLKMWWLVEDATHFRESN
jgi:hypothetical protein